MTNKYSKLIEAIKAYNTNEEGFCNPFTKNPDYLWAGYIWVDTNEDGITLYNTMSKDSMGEDEEICSFYYKDDDWTLGLCALYFEGTDALRKAFEEAGIKIEDEAMQGCLEED